MTKPPRPPLVSQKEDWNSKSLGFQACNGPTTGYRDGPNGVVEVFNFKDGYLPAGWFDNPVHCSNCSGEHSTTTYSRII